MSGMSRKTARETCFKLVFEYEFLKSKNPLSLEDFLVNNKFDDKDKIYITSTYEGILNNYENIVKIITKNLKGYTLNRVYKIDLAILIVAVYEFIYNKIDAKIVINEAVELSKKYSTEKSFSFINGVLAQIVKEEKNNG